MKLVKLNDVAIITTGKTPSKSDDHYYSGGTIPFVKPPNLTGSDEIVTTEEYLTEDGAKKANIIPKYSIMVSCIGSLGKVGIAGSSLVTNQQINSLTFDNKLVDYKYGYYFSLTLESTLKQIANSAVVPIVNKSTFSNLDFPLISLEDQSHIVKVLDQANALRQKRSLSLSLLDEYLRSAFLEMFGDPITNTKQWKTTEFSNLCSKIFGGGTPSKAKPEFYDGVIPWVTPKDMKRRFINDSRDHISNDAVEQSAVNLIPSYSVLMVIRSGILKNKLPVAINTTEVTVNQDMKAYVINPSIANPYFILFFFEIAQHYLLSKVRSVTADNIKFDDIKNCPIILPPIDLQTKFSEIIKKTESLKQKMLLQSQELDTQFQALMQKSFQQSHYEN